MKKVKNKKGFTLIEIIVVLVILAILAAAGIPTMMGFIADARNSEAIAEARVGYLAASSVVAELKMQGTQPGSMMTGDMFTADTAARRRFDSMTNDVGGTFTFNLSGSALNANVKQVLYAKDGDPKIWVKIVPSGRAEASRTDGELKLD